MNTAVNFSFQFLRRKLVIFSQFLFDDYIKSKLMREARQHQEQTKAMREQSRASTAAAANGNAATPPAVPNGAPTRCYPYANAEKLYKDVRKLGEARADVSVLDSFRVLITEIGNTMGYVRMVRAGGVHQTGETMQCLPDGPGVPDLPLPSAEPAAEEGGGEGGGGGGGGTSPMASLGEPCAGAHDLAARVIDAMRSSFDEPGEYFAALEEVFAQEVRSAKNAHLANFYIIVPALTINFVDAMLSAKDRLQKKQREAYFTDDGFAMVCALRRRRLSHLTSRPHPPTCAGDAAGTLAPPSPLPSHK
jgi:WASH complex subunit 7